MKRDSTIQQLVIPRGALAPGEAAVIEIPRRYNRAPVIVVKKRPGEFAEHRAASHFIPAPYDNMPLDLNPVMLTTDVAYPQADFLQIINPGIPRNSTVLPMASTSPMTPAVPLSLMAPMPMQQMSPMLQQVPQIPIGQARAQRMPPAMPMGPMMPGLGLYGLHPLMMPQYCYQEQQRGNTEPGQCSTINMCPAEVKLFIQENLEKAFTSHKLEDYQRGRRRHMAKSGYMSQRKSDSSLSSDDF